MLFFSLLLCCVMPYIIIQFYWIQLNCTRQMMKKHMPCKCMPNTALINFRSEKKVNYNVDNYYTMPRFLRFPCKIFLKLP